MKTVLDFLLRVADGFPAVIEVVEEGGGGGGVRGTAVAVATTVPGQRENKEAPAAEK